MKLHPVIEGQYRGEFYYLTEGNDTSNGGNCITHAMRSAVTYRQESRVAEVWESTAYHYAIRAAHAAHMLGLA